MANLRVGPRCLLPEGTARRPCAGDRAVLSPNRVTQLAARRTFSLRGVAESGHRKAFLREHRMQCGSPKAFSLRRTTGSVHRRPFGRQRGTGSPALIGFVHSLDNPRRVEFYFETQGPEGNGPFRPGPSRFSTKSVPRCFQGNRTRPMAGGGPRGANEGSRWEASTCGRGAPTGDRPRTPRAPAGRMNRGAARRP